MVLSFSALFITSSFSKESSINSIRQDQEKYLKAYVIVQNELKPIDLYFVPTTNGYMVFSRWVMNNQPSYNMPTRGDGGNVRAKPLNQQNSLAIKYNFTHYVPTTYGNLYFNSNQ